MKNVLAALLIATFSFSALAGNEISPTTCNMWLAGSAERAKDKQIVQAFPVLEKQQSADCPKIFRVVVPTLQMQPSFLFYFDKQATEENPDVCLYTGLMPYAGRDDVASVGKGFAAGLQRRSLACALSDLSTH